MAAPLRKSELFAIPEDAASATQIMANLTLANPSRHAEVPSPARGLQAAIEQGWAPIVQKWPANVGAGVVLLTCSAFWLVVAMNLTRATVLH